MLCRNYINPREAQGKEKKSNTAIQLWFVIFAINTCTSLAWKHVLSVQEKKRGGVILVCGWAQKARRKRKTAPAG